MKAIALACETIADEVRLAAQQTSSRLPLYWVESGMHNYPDKLRKHLQSEIDRIDNVDYTLLLFGYCGNSLLGLVSHKSRLVIPRVDDCISLLLGGNERRNALNREAMGYFLTRGWLSHENNLWNEYNYCVKKYGPERTRQIYHVMLHNYKKLNVIETGAYNLEALLPLTGEIARELALEHAVVEGTLDLLCRALRGDWDEQFVIIEPGCEVTLSRLGIIDDTEHAQPRLNNLGETACTASEEAG
ncbi:MAG TPA: DUF1638 domain-containing protein [Bacillota bacterium]|nr:DUF1638 domain-containing protein [Bacillota bacterium]